MDRSQSLRAVVFIQAMALFLAFAWGTVARLEWWNALHLQWSLILAALAGCAWGLFAAQRKSGVDSPEFGIGVVLCSAFAEEALFRGVLLPASGLVASSLIFGLLHPGSRLGSLLMGLVCGALMLLSGNLLASVAFHAASNATVFSRLRQRRA